MKGKVKSVYRNVLYEGNIRFSNVTAVLYNGDNVYIDEDDVRDYYDSSYITNRVMDELNDDLHNEYIYYYEDEDGDYWLDGDLDDYI